MYDFRVYVSSSGFLYVQSNATLNSVLRRSPEKSETEIFLPA